MSPPGQDPPALDLEGLLREHASGLRGAVRAVLGARADVDEVLGAASAKAWEALSRGDEPRDPRAWIFVIALNAARDHRRRRLREKTTQSLEELPVNMHPTQQPSPTAALEEREAIARARDAIHALPDSEREVFLMRTSADLSFAATAEALQIPIGTAKTRMRRALRNLRQALRAHAPHPLASPGASADGSEARNEQRHASDEQKEER